MDLAEIRKKAQRERSAAPAKPEVAEQEQLEQPPLELQLPDDFSLDEMARQLEQAVAAERPEPQRATRAEERPAPRKVALTEAPPLPQEDLFPEEMEEEVAPPVIAAPVKRGKGKAVAATQPLQPEPPVAAPEEEYSPLAVIIAGREAAGIFEDQDLLLLDGEVETVSSDTEQYLCFMLGSEEYAVSIMSIKEIVKPREVTEVPRAPQFVLGIISLRGVIIPVYDLHRRLELGNATPTGRERIIVVKHDEDFCGILVDRVNRVVKIKKKGIEPPPVVLEGLNRDFVQGLGRHDAGMFILLDLRQVLDVGLS
ncbi:MAG TPA: chemotaxis protein CheW [Geobacterales bacterium]|nr:chemotaxis protein CheW [Geobacterales bacterium]